MPQVTIHTLKKFKQQKQKFSCLTVYDASFAHLLSQTGVEVLLVGDSLGQVVQGHSNTIPVTLEQMIYHVQCVGRGNQGALLLADYPFMTYSTPEQAFETGAQLMQAGAHMIKLEGGGWLAETVFQLTQRGVPVCAHLGLTPQSVHKLGGYKIQGRGEQQAQRIIADALTLQEAGADLLVLECVPINLAKEISEKLTIPTIGIGAGPHTDGQVLVLYDMLGLTPGFHPKFVQNFFADQPISLSEIITTYINAVKEAKFPTIEQSFME